MLGESLSKLASRVGRQADAVSINKLKGLILAQNERWRRGLGMRVVREP